MKTLSYHDFEKVTEEEYYLAIFREKAKVAEANWLDKATYVKSIERLIQYAMINLNKSKKEVELGYNEWEKGRGLE